MAPDPEWKGERFGSEDPVPDDIVRADEVSQY